MILGIGVDIVKNDRFSKWLDDKKIIQRFFSTTEVEYINSELNTKQNKIEFLASRFAVKEAFVKALGTGFTNINLTDIYVTKNKDGKPSICFSESFDITKNKLDNKKIHLSLSHEKEFSIAYVIIESEEIKGR